jgi:membrane associated rhomboid family serine protease
MEGFYKIKKRKLFHLNANFLLILINLFCFILFSALIYFIPNFIDYIALKPANIISKFYLWTFITSMFMHGGFFHLLANMISLIFVGNLTERILGRKRFLTFYLISGLFAGLFFVLISFFFPADFNNYAVGASGALFGLVGLLMIITPNLSVYLMFIPIPIKMKFAAPAMLILLWLISWLGNVPIGNTAHLGGFIVGLCYGIYLKKKYKHKTEYLNKYFN